MRVTAGAATDVGLVREQNEDGFLSEPPLYAVADGMGGHRGGEVASAMVLEKLGDLGEPGAEELAEAVKHANLEIFERGLREREVAGMGTTVTAAVVEGEVIRLAHVGDSRAYLLRDGVLSLLTEDHTLVQEMVNEGSLRQEEAMLHPQRSILTRALGVEGEVEVDEHTVDVREGDRLLLCTDGLSATVSDEQVREILAGTPDPQEAAEKLVDAANSAGGPDNTTVIVLDVGDGSAPAGDS